MTPVSANKAAQADQVAVGGSRVTTVSGHGGAGHRGVLVTGSRRATAVGWASVTALSLAVAVLTVLAWSDLVTKDAVSNHSALALSSKTRS